MKRFLWPLAIFIVLLGFLAAGLKHDPSEVPSPLIGKPAPAFSLPQLAGNSEFSPQQMRGKVWLLNVWSTWCVSCRAEHAFLVEAAQQIGIPIIGLNYKEVRGDSELDARKLLPADELLLTRQRANAWIAEHGNPYLLNVLDMDGRVGIDYGVYGVPETYLIDREGIIRFKQIGPLTPEAMQTKILPKIKELNS
ncbi:periplasmic thioredoxin of cytochrome c-type biogenesis [Georgfuchsia toluolica]|uniref:Periplasmic thioredoxin of cytochrome c-type biogenesis n=1 Tax=Georgfuchsia toluolica TaxID=424218 RepID=A0A916J1U8_9PROT|nr:DsbE family thiol:disulfide interchange protein [Georgfuchsia toluolica]CAG4882418.1 periplasmic thioredoxin of cytochrome c-type biogenesis [Georgfuchsia toluolica]